MSLTAARRVVLLDSGPLSLATNPKASQQSDDCKNWLKQLLRNGHCVLVPEITDYELRRELLRAQKSTGLKALDALKVSAGYVPLTSSAMLKAAEFWAAVRQSQLPTADSLALDADMILAAQAVTLDVGAWDMPGAAVIIATTNVGHLARVAAAKPWPEIS